MWNLDLRKEISARQLATATTCSVLILLFAHVGVSEATPQALASISGRVLDLREQPVPNATIRIEDPSRGVSRETKTEEDGSFTLRTLQPGTYTITVEKEGYHPYQGDVTLQAGVEMTDVEVALAEPSPEAAAADLFEQGIQSYNNGDYEAAIEAFEQILEDVPDSFETLANLGQAYMAAGRYEEAASTLERAVEQDPTSTRTHLSLSLTYSHLGRYEDAEQILVDVLGENPDLQDPLMFQASIDLGNVYFVSKRNAQAVEVFEDALEVRPEHPRALLGLGKCHLQAERYEQALERFEQVVAVAPDSPEAQEARSFIEALKNGG